MVVCYILLCAMVYLACPVLTGPQTDVTFRCSSNSGTVCVIPTITFTDPSEGLKLQNAEARTSLIIKAGSIEALTLSHCESLRSFEKITIGRTGLRELCVANTFRQVTAENNNIRTLHTVSDGNFAIEILKLNNNQLDSVENMRNFVALKELHLKGNALTTLSMTSFARMASLERLVLGNNRLSRVGTDGVTRLPKLTFIGLANNTLTTLNVLNWEMESLVELELASNNLTQVTGIAKLTGLDEVSLASNQWDCLALDDMLVTLEGNSVTIKDGDRDCEGIRNTSICCTVVTKESEETLLQEMKKYTVLKERYEEATRKLDEQITTHKATFDQVLEEVKNAARTDPPAVTSGTPDGSSPAPVGIETKCEEGESTPPTPKATSEQTTEVVTDACGTFTKECICLKTELEAMRGQLKEMQERLTDYNRTVTAALANQPHLNRMAMLNKHEFRVAVKGGDHKVKEVHTKLAMLRDYIRSRLDSLG